MHKVIAEESKKANLNCTFENFKVGIYFEDFEYTTEIKRTIKECEHREYEENSSYEKKLDNIFKSLDFCSSVDEVTHIMKSYGFMNKNGVLVSIEDIVL